MRSIRFTAPLLVVLGMATFMGACGSSPSPSPSSGAPSSASASASPSSTPTGSAATATELPAAGTVLPAGTYTKAAFAPPITFAVEDGWTVGTPSNSSFDVRRGSATDGVAVQFARIQDLVGAPGATIPAETASDAVAAFKANPNIKVIDESASRLGGLEGLNVVVENGGDGRTPIFGSPLDTHVLDPGHRLWIALFDTADGVLAVMVDGSAAGWDKALATAEPVLESVVIGSEGGGASQPSASTGEVVHIALDGDGPLGIDFVGEHAWVVLTDSGGLVEVDLATRQVLRTIEIGAAGQQVVAGADGMLYIGRYTTGTDGNGILKVDPSSGTTSGIRIGPIGGLALDGEHLWALERTGEVSRIDASPGSLLGPVTVPVDQDAHMDLVASDGSAWVSGDRTPVHRISGDGSKASVAADIETGGGIPLAVEGGLVWGARPDELWAIDPASDAVTRHVALVGVDEILAMAVDVEAGEAWVAIRKPGRVGAVIAVDVATGTVLSDTPVSLPAGIRLTADHAWVTDYESDELVGIPRS